MSTVFTYEYNDTVIHKLNPLSKLILFGFFMLIGGIYIDPLYKLPMIAVLTGILMLARLPFKNYRAIIVLAAIGIVIGEFFTAITMVNPDYFKVYSKEFTNVQLLQITPPDFPVLGRTAITYGSLLWWVTDPLTIVTVILSVAGLLHTTALSHIVSVMSRAKLPFPAIFMVTVALRFVPELVQRIRIVQRAQSLRGWTAETRNPFKRIALVRPLLIPVTRYVMQSIDMMTMSSANRGFGIGPVTPTTSFDFTPLDRWISVGSVLLAVVAIYLTFAYDVGNI